MSGGTVINSTRIEALSKDNYDTWKMQIEALMIKNDLWEYVSGEIVCPAVTESSTATQSAATELARREWKRIDRKARSDLILSIHSSQLAQVRNLESSREVWLKLESIYASKGPARKATLLKQLILQRMSEGGDVRDHMSRFFDAVDKLVAMEVEINGDLLSIMLLYSLPSSFDNFRVAIESRDELPNVEALKVKILEEYDVRVQTPITDVTGALAARPSSKGKSNFKRNFKSKESGEATSRNQSKIWCFRCRKPGHKKPDCPELNKDESTKQPGKANSKSSPEKSSALAVDDTYLACTDAIPSSYRASCTGVRPSAWILDSGCTAHLCGDKDLFESVDESSKGRLNLANRASTDVEGKGAVRVPITCNEGRKIIELQNTLFVPDLRANLVSVSRITDKGNTVTFQRESAVVKDRNGVVKMKAMRRGDLYMISDADAVGYAGVLPVSPMCSSIMEWHKKLGHLNSKDLMKMVGSLIKPAPSHEELQALKSCEVCLEGKMPALPFPKGSPPCEETLRIIHSDVVGPFRTPSPSGARYFVTFVDDCSRMCQVYFLKEKSGVSEAFRLYKNNVECQIGRKVKMLQSDRGTEYCNSEMTKICEESGMEQRLTVARTPQQNGVSERMNRTLLDMARCLLLQSGLSRMFWADAVATACYIRNRCPSSSLGGVTPFEKWTGELPDLSNLKTFGAEVFVVDKDPTKDKLAPRSIKGVFIGYPRETKGYRVWVPEKRKAIVARDVRFMDSPRDIAMNRHEICDLLPENHGQASSSPASPFSPGGLAEVGRRSSPQVPNSPLQDVPAGTPMLSTPQYSRMPQTCNTSRRGRGRPRLLRTGSRGRPRKLYHSPRGSSGSELEEPPVMIGAEQDDDVFVDATDPTKENTIDVCDNLDSEAAFAGAAEVSPREAMKGKNSEEWRSAILSEIESLVRNETWKIVRSPPGQRSVGCRMVLTNKFNPDGTVSRRKARLVARGFSQIYGIDFHDTFAPVARLESLRLMLAIAAELEITIYQLDVVTAFLNGFLVEKVYMDVPEMLEEMLEWIVLEKTDPELKVRAQSMLDSLRSGGNACLLQKSIYGLRQAGRQWNKRITEKLKEIGLKPTHGDPCLFHARRHGKVLLLLVYVDDILVASEDTDWINEIKRKLMGDFDIKDLGVASYCLGLEIHQGSGEITLSQSGYIKDILVKYGMEGCNTVSTPSEVGSNRPADCKVGSEPKQWPYRELIGSLLYLVVGSRPDLANTVSRLAQFINDPCAEHWAAAKRVLRYLAGTVNLGLTYSKTGDSMFGYSDADWGGCSIDRRSYSGYAFILGGAVVSWKSQKQRVVALSSTESEYISMTEASKEAIYLQGLLEEMELSDMGGITLYVDNRGAQFLADNHMFHPRTKHMDIRHHFVREAVSKNIVVLEHISTTQMAADVLTKSLPNSTHWRCLEELGVVWIKHEEER